MAGPHDNRRDAVSQEAEMREVMALLDGWEAPEISPWFDSRVMSRVREEQTRGSEGIFARLRDWFTFSSALPYKPMLAGAMVLALMAGGGSYLEFSHSPASRPTSPGVSATVQDLQTLDKDEQAIQQMDQLLDDNNDDSSQS